MRATISLLLAAAALLAPAAADAEVTAAEASEVIQQALADMEAGNMDEAIARLEPWRQEETPPPLGMAILGALYLEADRPADAFEVLKPFADRPDADPAVLYNAGRAALALEKGDLAEAYMERSARLDPRSIAARELGLLRGAQGRRAEALALLRPWIAEHPKDRRVLMVAALSAVELQRVAEAQRYLDQIPDEGLRVELLRARLALMTGEPRAAVEKLEPHLEELPPPMTADVHRVLADAYLALGESAKVVKLLSGDLLDDPWLGLYYAQALNQTGRTEEAQKALAPFVERFSAAGPDDVKEKAPVVGPAIFREYGRILLAAGDEEQAAIHLQRAAALDPLDRQSWQMLGQALMAMGHEEEGKEALLRFEELVSQAGSDSDAQAAAEAALADPTGHGVREAMKWAQRGKPEKALEELRRQRLLAPEDPRPWLEEARLLLIMERKEEALAMAGYLLERFPDNADAHYLRGVAAMAMENRETAESELRRAIELSPGHTAAMNDLAVLLMVDKRRDEARTLLEEVLEIRPGDEQAQANLERLKAATGG